MILHFKTKHRTKKPKKEMNHFLKGVKNKRKEKKKVNKRNQKIKIK